MKFLAYLLIILGAIGIVINIHDELKEETTVYSPTGSSSASYLPDSASKADPKSNFRGAMNYQWIYSGSILFVGLIAISMIRHWDRHDPFSPDLDWPDNEN